LLHVSAVDPVLKAQERVREKEREREREREEEEEEEEVLLTAYNK